ncbi:MAG: hypothetical protein ABIK68_06655 [bacterium]
MIEFQTQAVDEKRKALMTGVVADIKACLRTVKNLETDLKTLDQWVDTVFQTAVDVSATDPREPQPVPPMTLPPELGAMIIEKLMDVLGYAYAFQDSGLYYLSDVGTALGCETAFLRSALDRKLDALRDEFSQLLLKELDPTHRHWCAVIILKTILADGVIHPSEKAYFKVINTLLSDSPKTPAELIAVAEKIETIPELKLDPEIVRVLMWHIVAIAMFDGEYVGQEAKFVKETALALQIDPSRIDDIIQPVAATFMVIQALYPNR